MKFPISRLHPIHATMTACSDTLASIEISFEPFKVPSPDTDAADPLDFNTPLRADNITLPGCDLSHLANKTFDFAVNPNDGYIDASVYFHGVHSPVDITQITFADLTDAQVHLTIVSKWLMTFEHTGFDDFDLTFTVPLRIKAPRVRSPKSKKYT